MPLRDNQFFPGPVYIAVTQASIFLLLVTAALAGKEDDPTWFLVNLAFSLFMFLLFPILAERTPVGRMLDSTASKIHDAKHRKRVENAREEVAANQSKQHYKQMYSRRKHPDLPDKW